MKILNYLVMDLVAVVIVFIFNYMMSKVTAITISDMFFWELGLLILASAAAMGLSRREIRRSVLRKDKTGKEKSRKTFLFTEKLSFNFALLAIAFYSLSLYFV